MSTGTYRQDLNLAWDLSIGEVRSMIPLLITSLPLIVCMGAFEGVFVCQHKCLSAWLSVCVCVCVSVCRSGCLLFRLSVFQTVCCSDCLLFRLQTVCQTVCLCVTICLVVIMKSDGVSFLP